jgi:predicted cobalt transporter CbtA
MNPRAFLVRGLLAGLLAGVATFLVAYAVGEPQVDKASSIEEAGAAAESHHEEDAAAGHTHEEDGTVVSRENQSTWGLATGTFAVSITVGGLVGLVAAGALGRIGRLSPSQSTAVVTAIGYVSVALVPFLKYPSTPPAVGNEDTIGRRTALYFTFLAISLVAAFLATVLSVRLLEPVGAYGAILAGVGLYLLVVVVAGALMPTVNEIGDFPGDVLWYFRRASIATLTTMWAVVGIVLTGLIGRLYREVSGRQARRELAASL